MPAASDIPVTRGSRAQKNRRVSVTAGGHPPEPAHSERARRYVQVIADSTLPTRDFPPGKLPAAAGRRKRSGP